MHPTFFFFGRVRNTSFEISEVIKYLTGFIKIAVESESKLYVIFIFLAYLHIQASVKTTKSIYKIFQFPMVALDYFQHNLGVRYLHDRKEQGKNKEIAGDQPRLIQGIRRRDGIGEDQDTIASIRY